MICHFPNISDEKLNDYVWKDETLLGMILIQFQMKIMEQLLAFCANQYASNLVLYIDDAEIESLEIYREFLFTEGYPLPQTADNSEIIIPTNKQAIQKWTKYVNKINIEFRQTLWREQRLNPAIRQYLKTSSSRINEINLQRLLVSPSMMSHTQEKYFSSGLAT